MGIHSILLLGMILIGACQSAANDWGERNFVLRVLEDWSDGADVSSCQNNEGDALFLFTTGNRYALITSHDGAYDVALIDEANNTMEIEANGGIARYIEIQEQVQFLKLLPSESARSEDYMSVITSTPRDSCSY